MRPLGREIQRGTDQSYSLDAPSRSANNWSFSLTLRVDWVAARSVNAGRAVFRTDMEIVMSEQNDSARNNDFCKECGGKPCFCESRRTGALKCAVCGIWLGLRGGMAGTDLCGPCCTGESETADEAGVTW